MCNDKHKFLLEIFFPVSSTEPLFFATVSWCLLFTNIKTHQLKFGAHFGCAPYTTSLCHQRAPNDVFHYDLPRFATIKPSTTLGMRLKRALLMKEWRRKNC